MPWNVTFTADSFSGLCEEILKASNVLNEKLDTVYDNVDKTYASAHVSGSSLVDLPRIDPAVVSKAVREHAEKVVNKEDEGVEAASSTPLNGEPKRRGRKPGSKNRPKQNGEAKTHGDAKIGNGEAKANGNGLRLQASPVSKADDFDVDDGPEETSVHSASEIKKQLEAAKQAQATATVTHQDLQPLSQSQALPTIPPPAQVSTAPIAPTVQTGQLSDLQNNLQPQEDAFAYVKQVNLVMGPEKAKSLIAEFGVEKFSLIPEDKRPELIERAKALLADQSVQALM